jgi:hypothetical protein
MLQVQLTGLQYMWGQLDYETKFSQKWVTLFGFGFDGRPSGPGSGARIPP